jgi:hypothetical protein
VSICLIDTSILCEILEVPNVCGSSELIVSDMEDKIRAGETLLLPMSTILETGNHIGQNGDGRQRRRTATKFVRLIEQAVRGETPFTPTPFFEPQELLGWIGELPDWAGRVDPQGKGSGLGDLTIYKEFERQCGLHRARQVYIWSLDRHLSSYSREP